MIDEEKAYSQTCIKQSPTGNCKDTTETVSTELESNAVKKMLFYAIIALNSKFIDKLAKKCIDSLLNIKQNQQNGDMA